jgi:amino acid transporter
VPRAQRTGTPGQRAYQRELGSVALSFVSLGSIIGSGWLLGAWKASQVAGASSLVSWVLAGIAIVLLALVHAELSSTYPLAGGTARYPKAVFGGFAGFSAGWVSWVQAVTIAPVEVEAVMDYLNKVLGLNLVDLKSGALTLPGLALAILLVALFTVLNGLGVRWFARTNNVITVWKIAVPVLIVVMLLVTSFHKANFTAGGGFVPYGAHGIFAALPAGVAFALQGFEQAAQLGGEAKDPQRTLPRAIIGAFFVAIVLYLALEVAFIGAVNPANLVHGWASPIAPGTFGPYTELAAGAGLTWLVAIVYTDAFISPAGTGLVFTTTSSRLAYALSAGRFLPRSLSRISVRGVPIWSIVLSFVVGVICFLPFPSWNALVGFISSATFIMYGFAPIALLALRKTDVRRKRPYRLPAAGFLAPLSFIAANVIVYCAGWNTNWKVLVTVLVGYVFLTLSYLFRGRRYLPPLNLRSLFWIMPWLCGTAVISYLGQYNGIKVLPPWIDLAVVVVFSLVIFYLALGSALPEDRVAVELAAELADDPAITVEPESDADPDLAESPDMQEDQHGKHRLRRL